VLALASPLPRIEAKLPNGNVITLVPFAKSVDGSSIPHKGNFQPTNQIVDFYVEQIANSGRPMRTVRSTGALLREVQHQLRRLGAGRRP
jgi:type IV pilus assembly protein PilY1